MGYNISVEAPETSAERKDKSNMRVCVCARIQAHRRCKKTLLITLAIMKYSPMHMLQHDKMMPQSVKPHSTSHTISYNCNGGQIIIR